MRRYLVIGLAAASLFAAEGFKVLSKIHIGGAGGWDYLTLDNANRRLYVSHGATVEVVDPDAGKVVGQVPGLHGVHGIAVAPELNKGFITNRTTNSVTVFDLKSLQKVGEPAVGKNPDAICYEPKTRRIVAMNHSGNDATVIDAKSNEIVGTVPLGPAPEFCVTDGAGKVYVNLEGSSETLEIDVAKPEVTRRVSLAPAEGPTGLAIDAKNKKLFAACAGSKSLAVIDIPSFKVLATPPTGAGADGAGFDSGLGLAFTSNGDGTLTIVKPVNGKYETVDTVQTERGARTMTVDEKLHRVYLLAAEYGQPAEAKEGVKRGPTPIKQDTFHVLVVGK